MASNRRRAITSALLALATALGAILAVAPPATAGPAGCSPDPIGNCGFETGDLTNWAVNYDYGPGTIDAIDPLVGNYSWLGTADGTGASISQTVVIQAGETCTLREAADHRVPVGTEMTDDMLQIQAIPDPTQVPYQPPYTVRYIDDPAGPPTAFDILDLPVTVTEAVTFSFTVTGTDGSSYAIDAVGLTCVPTVNWTAPTSVTYGTNLSSILTATSPDAGTIGYTVAAGPAGTVGASVTTSTLLPAGAYVLFAGIGGSLSATHDLTVSPHPLTVIASSATVQYGQASAVTPGYIGFVNNDGPAALSTQPTCAATAPAHPAPGAYTTSCTGASAANYAIIYDTGSLTVTKATTTLTSSASAALLVTTFSARLTRSFDGAPLAGQRITFTENNRAACTAVTNAAGSAQCRSTGLRLLAPARYTTSFGGDADYTAAAVSEPV